jgi:hypothetical protein
MIRKVHQAKVLSYSGITKQKKKYLKRRKSLEFWRHKKNNISLKATMHQDIISVMMNLFLDFEAFSALKMTIILQGLLERQVKETE